MHAHFVLAHPEPQSFKAHFLRSGSEALRAQGWTVSAPDLHAMGCDPCERPEHFGQRAGPDRFDVQAGQRHASGTGTLPTRSTVGPSGVRMAASCRALRSTRPSSAASRTSTWSDPQGPPPQRRPQ